MKHKAYRIPFILLLSLLLGTALSNLLRAGIYLTVRHFDALWWTGGFVAGVITSACIVFPVCITLPFATDPQEAIPR